MLPDPPLVAACWSGGSVGDTAFFRVTADGGTLLTGYDLEPSPNQNEVTFGIPYVPGGYVGFCSIPWILGEEPFDPNPITVTVIQIGSSGLMIDSLEVVQEPGPTTLTPPDTVAVFSISPSNPVGVVIYHNGGGQLVPTTPPDSVPSAYLADSNLTDPDSAAGVRWPRNLLRVSFVPGATQAQRDSAISAIGGTVVGGLPFSDNGYFLIAIEDDGTGGPLLDAIVELEQMPQVEYASQYFILPGIELSWIRPNDGTGWQQNDWGVLPDRAGGANWHMERVAMPLAWGCEIGDSISQVSVGVLDHIFHANTDLSPNLNSNLSYGV
jgi:hypothetical protein